MSASTGVLRNNVLTVDGIIMTCLRHCIVCTGACHGMMMTRRHYRQLHAVGVNLIFKPRRCLYHYEINSSESATTFVKLCCV